MLKRNKMPVDGAVLKIIIGIIFLVFIVGVLLIVSGLRELKRIKLNNAATPDVLTIDNNVLIFKTIHKEIISTTYEQIRIIEIDNRDGLYYLRLKNDRSYQLGKLDRVAVENFNELLMS